MEYEDLNILVVDDNRIVCDLLTKQLNVIGITNVKIAESSTDAKGKINEDRFDIVFLDWHMPGQDGLAFLEECRNDNELDDVAFIMVTSEVQKSYVIEAKAAGATLYMMKPVSDELIKLNVNEAIVWLKRQRDQKG